MDDRRAGLQNELADLVQKHRDRGLDRMSCLAALLTHAVMLALIDGINSETFGTAARTEFEKVVAKLSSKVDA